MTAYYNEFDPKAAAWLRELIKAGLIAAGEVDTRSIADVQPSDLDGFTQCHFFAGIGGWSRAIRLAGWTDDRPVWTGSCPCQPFSCAGKRKGEKDERHLWPEFRRLISERKPSTVFGEQVASKAGRLWLSGIRADLEALGYAVGAADLCAAGVGAPHIRQRLCWGGQWLGNATSQRLLSGALGSIYCREKSPRARDEQSERSSDDGGLVHSEGIGRPGRQDDQDRGRRELLSGHSGEAHGLEHATGDGREQRRTESGRGSIERGCGTGWLGHAIEQGLEGHAGMAQEAFDHHGKFRNRIDQLPRQAMHLTSGPSMNSSPAETEKRGALNPDLPRWLMGYPAEWDSCGATAMQSCRKSRRNS